MLDGEVGCVEELHWLISTELSRALDGPLLQQVCEGQIVLGVDSDATTIGLSLIQALVNTLVIVMKQAPVLHQFDLTGLDNTTSLRVMVHDCNLNILCSVSHSDS